MTQSTSVINPTLNGFEPAALNELAQAVATDDKQGKMAFHVSTDWVNGAQSVSSIKSLKFGNETIERNFTLTVDEPEEVGGTNAGANPQELLLTAVNTCLLTTFNMLCTLEGIQLKRVSVESHGYLNLRGFFGMDEAIVPGCQSIDWTLSVQGDGTKEQFQQVYEAAIAASPNLWNLANPVKVVPHLRIEAAD